MQPVLLAGWLVSHASYSVAVDAPLAGTTVPSVHVHSAGSRRVICSQVPPIHAAQLSSTSADAAAHFSSVLRIASRLFSFSQCVFAAAQLEFAFLAKVSEKPLGGGDGDGGGGDGTGGGGDGGGGDGAGGGGDGAGGGGDAAPPLAGAAEKSARAAAAAAGDCDEPGEGGCSAGDREPVSSR